MGKAKVKAGDLVTIVSGAEKGRTGKVLKVLPTEAKVVVEGVRRVRRNRKPVGDQPGGVVEKELPIHISNVALWNVEEKRKVRVAIREVEGVRVRTDRKTGTVIDR